MHAQELVVSTDHCPSLADRPCLLGLPSSESRFADRAPHRPAERGGDDSVWIAAK
jgi:hypothetical protein